MKHLFLTRLSLAVIIFLGAGFFSSSAFASSHCTGKTFSETQAQAILLDPTSNSFVQFLYLYQNPQFALEEGEMFDDDPVGYAGINYETTCLFQKDDGQEREDASLYKLTGQGPSKAACDLYNSMKPEEAPDITCPDTEMVPLQSNYMFANLKIGLTCTNGGALTITETSINCAEPQTPDGGGDGGGGGNGGGGGGSGGGGSGGGGGGTGDGSGGGGGGGSGAAIGGAVGAIAALGGIAVWWFWGDILPIFVSYNQLAQTEYSQARSFAGLKMNNHSYQMSFGAFWLRDHRFITTIPTQNNIGMDGAFALKTRFGDIGVHFISYWGGDSSFRVNPKARFHDKAENRHKGKLDTRFMLRWSVLSY